MDKRSVEVREHRFEDDGRIPNNPGLSLLFYPGALPEPDREPARCKELLARNGWGGAWVDGVFSYHHYHSTSHEVLCVVGGSARIEFGGPEGATVEAGDAVVIPAGVGHRDARDRAWTSGRSAPTPEARSPTTCAPERRASGRR